MSKQRYNILRIALGIFTTTFLIQLLQAPESLSRVELLALSFGLFAAAVDYWSQRKEAKTKGKA